mmetsp:Transcript_18521/g.45463  ORF Transcript_18521/g.45463 Transcript_18521/m.45463 type:complete len:163 (+) Transcript_18521:1-489(+)
MMVRDLSEQGAVMIATVQNHTPSVMVIDEIGRKAEVEAARTCKQRGVRMLASAHGDLRKLIKNGDLKGLVGGTLMETLGDTLAKEEAKKRGFGEVQKTKAVRANEPVFDVIVEMKRNSHHCWTIIHEVSDAVDAVLEGAKYVVERRARNPQTGQIYVCEELS